MTISIVIVLNGTVCKYNAMPMTLNWIADRSAQHTEVLNSQTVAAMPIQLLSYSVLILSANESFFMLRVCIFCFTHYFIHLINTSHISVHHARTHNFATVTAFCEAKRVKQSLHTDRIFVSVHYIVVSFCCCC